MRKPVIAILLDALEPAWLDRWIAQGQLPTLAKLRADSARFLLHGVRPFTGELPQVVMLTSTLPEKLKYWGAFNYDALACEPRYVRAYDYGAIRNFYDYSPGLKVCQFDLPKAGFARVAEGLQVLNWGAHGSLNDSSSNPPELFDELVRVYGLHPGLEKDHVEPWQYRRLNDLMGELVAGVRLRTRVHRDLLARANWDLFLTSYSEFHSGGHCYLHFEDPSYPLYERKVASEPILAIAREIDASIADLLLAAPTNAAISVFSVHGMVKNSWEINSMYILPEFLHRLAFPQRIRQPNGPPPPPSVGKWWWADTVWDLTFGNTRPKPNMGEGINWLPGAWYASDWPRMAAFAIPSLDEGMIRLNIRGRDPQGRVQPDDYDRVLGEIGAAIDTLKDARTGKRLIARLFRTRSDPLDDGPHVPPADLIVEWTQDPCDVADSRLVGRIGPVPLRRTGGHSPNGFAWFKDERLPPGDQPKAATPYDLGPTLLDLIGADIPDHFDGCSVLSERRKHTERTIFREFDPNL